MTTVRLVWQPTFCSSKANGLSIAIVETPQAPAGDHAARRDTLVLDEQPYLVPLLESIHRQRRYLVVLTDSVLDRQAFETGDVFVVGSRQHLTRTFNAKV